MKQLSALIIACSVGLAVQAQTVIDPLTGGLGGYTTTMVLDNSTGTGQGVSFTSSGSGLQANYVGTGVTAEQALFLAPASSFSSLFSVGQTLTVNVSMSVSSTPMDFGLAIAAATPVAASAGNAWNSRTAFDWASISVRPSQTAIRANTSISGTLVTGAGVLGAAANTVSELYITWNPGNVFTLGYIDSSNVSHVSESVTFAGASTIGTQIGFYGDLRGTATSLGYLSNLAVPEPSSLALCGMALAGWVTAARRKK